MYTSCLNYGRNYGENSKGHRANGFTTDGGFAQYAVNHTNTLVRVPRNLTDELATLPAEAIVAQARAAKGASLVVAAHVDREAFSIIGQLGFIPESLVLDALEISANTDVADMAESFGYYGHRFADQRRCFHHAMGDQRANTHAVGLSLYLSQSGNRLQIDQVWIVKHPLLHQDDQRGTAADDTRIIAVLCEQAHRLGQRTGLE
jgi:hypothetical protein